MHTMQLRYIVLGPEKEEIEEIEEEEEEEQEKARKGYRSINYKRVHMRVVGS